MAVIDTGCTNSCISEVVARAMNLQPVGQMRMRSAFGEVQVKNRYVVSISIGKTIVRDALLTETPLDSEEQLLIGMDLIDELYINRDSRTGEHVAAISFVK